MLKKLLKYDLKYVFRYSWLAIVLSLALSVVGGVLVSLIDGKNMPSEMVGILMMFIFLIGLCFFAVPALLLILSFARFYKHLFTDEGYLTFTLPVKLSTQLNSKLLLYLIVGAVSMATVFTEVALMILVSGNGAEVLDTIGRLLSEAWADGGALVIVLIFEKILYYFVYQTFMALALYCCITFASVNTKRARVITAIGLFFGCAVSYAMLSGFVSIFRSLYFMEKTYELSTFREAVVTVMNDGVSILFCSVFCVLLYILQYRMLDKHLNLS